MSALLAFYFKINPDDLDDEEFIRAWTRLKYALDWAKKNKINSLGI